MKALTAAGFATTLLGVLVPLANAAAECDASTNLPSRQFFVSFESNDDHVSRAQSIRLHQWIADMNSAYPIQHWIFVIGSASARERDPSRLAMRRAAAVTRLAIDDGLVAAPFQMKAQVVPSEGAAAPDAQTREVTVQISPGCPNDCCGDAE